MTHTPRHLALNGILSWTISVLMSAIDGLTKRTLVSSIAKIYDVLGWFSPVIIKVKTLLQRLWESEVDWDEPVPEPHMVSVALSTEVAISDTHSKMLFSKGCPNIVITTTRVQRCIKRCPLWCCLPANGRHQGKRSHCTSRIENQSCSY